MRMPIDRWRHDTSPAACWTDGFRTGNGDYGAVLYGEPAMEKVVFERSADRSRHPAYEFQISSPGMAAVGGYDRITDFRTGEVTSTWTDGYGTWTRRAFASRADQVIAHELLPAPGRTVDTTLSVDTTLDGLPDSMRFTTRATVSNGSGYLTLRSACSSGRAGPGYEGITRVVAFGGSVFASGATLVVTGAARLLLLTKLDRYESSTGWIFHALRTALAGLDSDYATLFARHTAATPA